MRTLALILSIPPLLIAQDSYKQFQSRFDYDRRIPLDIRGSGVERRGGVAIHDLSYAGPKGGRVPAYVVVPDGGGPFAAIIMAHWMMKGSPVANRREFLEEAVVLARAGAICLLPDAPFVRPGAAPFPDDFLDPTLNQMLEQQVFDLRRGVDLLLGRREVDRKRVAYVGHSFDAHAGAILAGVEKRIRAFVLMAGVLALEEGMLRDDVPDLVKWRKEMGEAKIRAHLSANRKFDPVYYLAHATPAALLFQQARQDSLAGEPFASAGFRHASEPKTLRLYNAAHALNAEARRDRVAWLAVRLGLQPPDEKTVAAIPEVK